MHDAQTPTTVSSWWDSLPDYEKAPPGAERVVREGTASTAPGTGRRRFLQVGLALGGALALNGLQALSGVRLKPAGATVGTEHTNCAGYDATGGYVDNSVVCVGPPYSYIYCGSDGWFKDGYFDGGTSHYKPVVHCGNGYNVSFKNAWRWSYGSNRYRCADGVFRYKKYSEWTNWMSKTCSQWIGYA